MKPSYPVAAWTAFAVAVAFAGPALAQPAAGVSAGGGAQEAAAAPAPATVTGRDLLTAEERASFRREMRQAAPEQRQALWEQKRTELAQRASARGLVLAEPASARNGTPDARSPGRRSGEGGGSMMSRMLRWSPRAP